MFNDVSKMVIIAILALVAYNVVIGGNLIKNYGDLNVLGQAGGEEHSQDGPAHPQQSVQHLTPAQAQARQQAEKRVEHSQVQDEVYKNNPNVLPHPQMSNNFSSQGNFQPSSQPMGGTDCFPKNDVLPQELLPREGGFAESNPAGQGHLSNRNFFESGHHPGLNTQSSTLKNPNLQLRSDPLIPRRDVGPWNQSTIEADTNRRQFEVGGI